jgi:hypothetical protein
MPAPASVVLIVLLVVVNFVTSPKLNSGLENSVSVTAKVTGVVGAA